MIDILYILKFFVFCLKNFREVLWCAMTYHIITGSYSILEDLENELSFPNAIYLNCQSTCDLQVSYMKLDYMCLPVLTWEVGELHVQFGLLVSTCAYLRGRTATCAQLDYLCLTCAYLRYLCLHLHTCCIESLPVHTCCTCGMISLSNINAPVLRNDLTTWACTHKKYM